MLLHHVFWFVMFVLPSGVVDAQHHALLAPPMCFHWLAPMDRWFLELGKLLIWCQHDVILGYLVVLWRQHDDLELMIFSEIIAWFA